MKTLRIYIDTSVLGGCFDPETGILYVSSITNPDGLSLSEASPARSNMGYVGGGNLAARGAVAFRSLSLSISGN